MISPGDRFGDYTVVRQLGQGGMGSVCLLESVTGGLVAAKILDPAASGDHESRLRFLREAELALGVKHPNLVETYDVGEDPETGLCYILMEYVPGGSLADRIDKGPLPIRDAIRIVYQVASVLELARERGIVHRDIKPGNILFGADGKAKLADLGIARGGFAGGNVTTVTQTGMMIGTPAYMAPEQMLDAHNVDIRADIYSLGIVFYEMLAGERPNKDDTVVQLMAKAMKGEPLPDVRTLRPEVSAAVAELVSLMCAMKADERAQTPAEVTTAISQIVHGREVTIRRKAPKVRSAGKRRFFSGWTLRKALGVVGVALTLAGLTVFVARGLSGTGGARTDQTQAVAVKSEVRTNVVEQVPVVTNVPNNVPVVIGCDISAHGSSSFYNRCANPGSNPLQLDRDARVVPLLFKLTREVLGKVNLLVLSPGMGAFRSVDGSERDAIREFAESGGVVLVLVHSTGIRPGESNGSTKQLLQEYGAAVYNSPREFELGVRMTGDLAAIGISNAPPSSTYADCSTDWIPLAVAQDDPAKVVSAVRQVRNGFFILAPASYAYAWASTRAESGEKFPWKRILLPRLKPVRHPDVSFAGSVIDDAPNEARSARFRFVSSDYSEEDLRWIAKMDDEAVKILTRRFGEGSFARNPLPNCIVRFTREQFFTSPTWLRRLDVLGAVELKLMSPRPWDGNGSVIEFLGKSILSPRENRFWNGGFISVTRYMACSVYEELRRNGHFRSGYRGVSGEIEFARKLDPNFSLYDSDGLPTSSGTPGLASDDNRRYVGGRFFAMLEDLHKRKPDLFVRYRQARLLREDVRLTRQNIIDDLCVAFGGDLPRRWPAGASGPDAGDALGGLPKGGKQHVDGPTPQGGNPVKANPVRTDKAGFAMTEIPGVGEGGGCVRIVGLAVAGELDGMALRQLDFAPVADPVRVPYGKRLVVKLEYDLPPSAQIWIGVERGLDRMTPSQGLSFEPIRLLSGSPYCRGRGVAYRSVELLEGSTACRLRTVRLSLQNTRPDTGVKGAAISRQVVPVDVDFEPNGKWSAVTDVRNDADAERVLDEQLKKSFSISRCTLAEALAVVKTVVNDRLEFVFDRSVDESRTVGMHCDWTTADGRRMTVRDLMSSLCKDAGCRFKVSNRKVVLFRDPVKKAP